MEGVEKSVGDVEAPTELVMEDVPFALGGSDARTRDGTFLTSIATSTTNTTTTTYQRLYSMFVNVDDYICYIC